MKLKARDGQPKQMNKRIVFIKKIGIFNIYKIIRDIHSLPKSRVFATCLCFSLQVALTHTQTNQPTNHCKTTSSFCNWVSHCSLGNASCWWLTRSCCLSTNSEIMIQEQVCEFSQMNLWGGTENMEEVVLSTRSTALWSGWYSLLSCLIWDTSPCKCPKDKKTNTCICSVSLHPRLFMTFTSPSFLKLFVCFVGFFSII